MKKIYFLIAVPVAFFSLNSLAATDFGTVIQIKPGTKTYQQQDYVCEDQVFLKKSEPSRLEYVERSLLGGALGYGLGHRSHYRNEIAGSGAVLGWMSTPEPQPEEEVRRVCHNVMVPNQYQWGYDVVVEYKGEKKSYYSEKPYKVGDSYPITVSWN